MSRNRLQQAPGDSERGCEAPRRHRVVPSRSTPLAIKLRLPGALLVAELDALALGLVLRLARLERALAHAAGCVSDARAWRLEGYARKSDYAREVLDRSSRWLSDRAVLGRALRIAPELGEALVGDDGRAPIGTVAAIEIARLLDDANELPLSELPRWIARAREVSAQQLRADARECRRAMNERPASALGESERATTDSLAEQPHAGEHTTLRVELAAPPAVRAAFAESLELFRCVAGGQAPVRDFIEALLAECACAPAGSSRDPSHEAAGQAPVRDSIEAPLAEYASAAADSSRDHSREAAGQAPVRDFIEAPLAECACAPADSLPDHSREAAGQAPVRDSIEAPLAERACAPAGSSRDHSREAAGQAPVRDFTEAPLAERACAPAGSSRDHSHEAAGRDRTSENQEPKTATARDAWVRAHGRLVPPTRRSDAISSLLGEMDALVRDALAVGAPGPEAPADHGLRCLPQLLVAEKRVRAALGEVLDRLRRARPFSAGGRRIVPHLSLGHYAEERLGLSASVAERLARLARGTRRYDALRESYENGLAGEHATLALLRLLDRSAGARAAESDWVVAAERFTLRRIADEVRAFEGRDALRPLGGAALPPLPDDAWLASCSRKPGEGARRVRVLAAHALAHCGERRQRLMHLDLPFELALDLEQALGDAARSHSCTSLFAASPDRPETPPRWAALLALLLEAVHEWDAQAEEHTPRAWSRRVYARDGYRCMAPGCTARAHLEEHHVHYRARGGGDEPGNRVTLCRFHHQQGEHGGLMQVRGVAPAGLLWHLGRGDGPWFECDRRLD